MTDALWSDTYDYAVRAFGQAPRPQDEQHVLEAFTRSPDHVHTQIDAIADLVHKGSIRWGWSALAARLDKAKPSSEHVVPQATQRDTAISNAKNWLRTAGKHYPTHEVEAELFGTPGMTAPLEYLTALEVETRGRPGRVLYDGLLKASITRTTELGPQEIPETAGMLHQWANDQHLHDELMALHAELAPTAADIEGQAIARGAAYGDVVRRLRAKLEAKRNPPPTDTSDFPPTNERSNQ